MKLQKHKKVYKVSVRPLVTHTSEATFLARKDEEKKAVIIQKKYYKDSVTKESIRR